MSDPEPDFMMKSIWSPPELLVLRVLGFGAGETSWRGYPSPFSELELAYSMRDSD